MQSAAIRKKTHCLLNFFDSIFWRTFFLEKNYFNFLEDFFEISFFQLNCLCFLLVVHNGIFSFRLLETTHSIEFLDSSKLPRTYMDQGPWQIVTIWKMQNPSIRLIDFFEIWPTKSGYSAIQGFDLVLESPVVCIIQIVTICQLRAL